MASSATLSVRIPARLKKDLDSLARATARSRSWIALDALQNYLEVNRWQIEAIREGLAQAEEGRLIRHDKVVEWVESWGGRNEKERPR